MLGTLVFAIFFAAAPALAAAPVEFLGAEPNPEFAQSLRKTFETQDTRKIRAEKTESGWIIRVFSKKYHHVESAQLDDHSELTLYSPKRTHARPFCPDESVQFLGFAPNEDEYELQVTTGVVEAAKAKGYATVLLAKKEATSQAFVNYLSCPGLIGTFYDGDANPEEIATADGSVSHRDLAQLNFNYHVTHMWLACQAFNDPMRSTMLNLNRSQKYAAGKNDLIVGPSDETAACAMKASLNGEKMSQAFTACYEKLDDKADQWGFDGSGSDFFAH